MRCFYTLGIILVCILILAPFPITLAYEAYIVVYTDKPEYPYFRQLVKVYGNVYYQGQAVEGGIVAIQVQYPNATNILLRTVPTGSNASLENWEVEIISLTPCDQYGNPKSNFYRGQFAFFYVIVKNNRIAPRDTLITLTIFDTDLSPLNIMYISHTLQENETFGVIFETLIPEWCSTGTAKAYACVLNEWPNKNGYPYSPERAATFNILSYTTGGSSQTYEQPQSSTNEYTMTFRLKPFTPIGNYSVTVSGYYKGFKCWRETAFLTFFHELGDFDFDHDIDLYDAVRILGAYGAKSGDPSWNPILDVAPNGKIELYDSVIVLGKYGKKY
jgi:hypothetical protein